MTLPRPQSWLPALLDQSWDDAVEHLRGQGHTFAVDPAKPTITGSHDQDDSDIQREVKVKVYPATPHSTTQRAWVRQQADDTVEANIDIQAAGDEYAHPAATMADNVCRRILSLHRNEPHPDWSRFETWETRVAQNYPDYQHWILTTTLKAYNRVLEKVPV